MRLQITIEIDDDKDWIRSVVTDAFYEIVGKVERRALRERMGLPWTIDPKTELPEISGNFEIAVAEQSPSLTGGMTWTLRGFWLKNDPPNYLIKGAPK